MAYEETIGSICSMSAYDKSQLTTALATQLV